MNLQIRWKYILTPNCDIDQGVWESISQKLQQRFRTLKFAMENWSVVKLIFTQNFWQKYLVSNKYLENIHFLTPNAKWFNVIKLVSKLSKLESIQSKSTYKIWFTTWFQTSLLVSTKITTNTETAMLST